MDTPSGDAAARRASLPSSLRHGSSAASDTEQEAQAGGCATWTPRGRGPASEGLHRPPVQPTVRVACTARPHPAPGRLGPLGHRPWEAVDNGERGPGQTTRGPRAALALPAGRPDCARCLGEQAGPRHSPRWTGPGDGGPAQGSGRGRPPASPTWPRPGLQLGRGDPRRGLAASSPLHAARPSILLRAERGAEPTPPCSEGTRAGLKGHRVDTATLERAAKPPVLSPPQEPPWGRAASGVQNPPPLPIPPTGISAVSPGPTS